MPEEKKSKVIVIDFECAGGVPHINGFTQVGAILGDVDSGEVLQSFNKYASMDGFEWEERCVEEFWKKNPERYAETLKNVEGADHPKVVIKQLIEWIQEVTKDCKDDVMIISDNVAFDIGHLVAFSGVDVLYLFGTKRKIVDTGCVNMGVSRKRVRCDTLNESSNELARKALKVDEPMLPVKHDHNPVNDATSIFLKWRYLEQFKDEL